MTEESHKEQEPGQTPPALEELRLHPSRPPVTRLSRKVLLGIFAAAAVGLGAAFLVALHPQDQTFGTELYHPAPNRTVPDALANLPRDYTGLPKPVPLPGSPPPGDRGKGLFNAGAPSAVPRATSMNPEEQRRMQENEAARTSPLFVTRTAAAPSATAPSPTIAPGAPQPVNSTADPAPQDHKLAFLNEPIDRRTATPDRILPPASPYIVQAGTVIPAALITGLRSDLPGQVSAQVTENVYDSPTGRILLIPQGSRLIGEYDAQTDFGQSRALLVWNRLILPNGTSIILERQPASDAQGYAGLEDQVDNHWGALFKATILSTILSVGAEAGTSNSENNLASAIRRGASEGFNQAGEQIVGRSLNIQPTITIRPGFPVRVLVTHDLVLAPYAD
jgi:type IV secretion system protein TrbI